MTIVLKMQDPIVMNLKLVTKHKEPKHPSHQNPEGSAEY